MSGEFVEDRYPTGHAETGVPVANAIAELAEVARGHGVRGYYSRSLHGHLPVERGRWAEVAPDYERRDDDRTAICDQLSPADDVVFEKYKPSVFFGTQLASMLNADGVDTLVVTGMLTSGCVRASIVDAFSYYFRVVVPEECVADRSGISHEFTLFDVDAKYADVRPVEDVTAALAAGG